MQVIVRGKIPGSISSDALSPLPHAASLVQQMRGSTVSRSYGFSLLVSIILVAIADTFQALCRLMTMLSDVHYKIWTSSVYLTIF
jgi:hypothetical protein